jgi:uncharacterized protein (DUF433 family)
MLAIAPVLTSKKHQAGEQVTMTLPKDRIPELIPHPHVRMDPSILSGSPYVEGSRVPVRRLWAWHRGGVTIETLVKRYPKLGQARVLDALAFAYDNQELIDADLEREQELMAKSGQKPVGIRPLTQQALPLEDQTPPGPATRIRSRK